MTMLRRSILLSAFLALTFLPGSAQATGEWFTAAISFNLPKKFSAKVSTSERFLNTGVGLVKYLFQFEGGYKISKHFDVALIYRTAWRIENDGRYHYRDKLMAEISADQSAGRFGFANRLRYQRRTKSYREDDWDAVPLQHMRDKVSIDYDIPKCKFTPVVYGEFFFPLYAFKTRTVDEVRLGADLKYKFNKHHAVKGGIMIQNGVVGIPVRAVWFKMGYTYSLKL